MSRTDIHEIKMKRCSNWLPLFNQLEQAGMLDYVASLFTELSDGDVPLGFVVRVRSGLGNGLRRQLAESGIYCPVHWGVTHLAGAGSEFPIEWELSQNILTFPIDHRMSGGTLNIARITSPDILNDRRFPCSGLDPDEKITAVEKREKL